MAVLLSGMGYTHAMTDSDEQKQRLRRVSEALGIPDDASREEQIRRIVEWINTEHADTLKRLSKRECKCNACAADGPHHPWCDVHNADHEDEPEPPPCDCGQRIGKRVDLHVPKQES